tara:strand:- start:101 stop:436 length:336 start_codon:yes stop_codon:yes gene_type:complete
MIKTKGLRAYKKYWQEQASFIGQSPWSLQKILKLTVSNDFYKNIEETKFSKHSISRENGQLTLRLKVPYNYSELDKFELKAIELLGIDKNWLINMSLENSNCTHNLKDTND